MGSYTTPSISVSSAPSEAILAAHVAEKDDADRQPVDTAYTIDPTSSSTPEPRNLAQVTVHDTTWVADDVQEDVQASVPFKAWSIVSASGEYFGPGSDVNGVSTLDYFLMMFPPAQLGAMGRMTNERLLACSLLPTTTGELVKFFGILVLTTRVQFGSRASLWSNKKSGKFLPAPSFGSTGMLRDRFDSLWRLVRFSHQPGHRPTTMSSEAYRWRLVDDFVARSNEYRVTNFNPSNLICVDESMSRWYGKGGFWINNGLLQYITIDRKPENGCEIQNSACGRSHIMMHIKLVKTAEAADAMGIEDTSGVLHGALVLKQLVQPWRMTGRIVRADSYFSSVFAAEYLSAAGLRFIGVVKTATRRSPMAALSQIELQRRGDRQGFVCLNEDKMPKLLAFVWMDRNRRYFVSSCLSLVPGAPTRDCIGGRSEKYPPMQTQSWLSSRCRSQGCRDIIQSMQPNRST